MSGITPRTEMGAGKRPGVRPEAGGWILMEVVVAALAGMAVLVAAACVAASGWKRVAEEAAEVRAVEGVHAAAEWLFRDAGAAAAAFETEEGVALTLRPEVGGGTAEYRCESGRILRNGRPLAEGLAEAAVRLGTSDGLAGVFLEASWRGAGVQLFAPFPQGLP